MRVGTLAFCTAQGLGYLAKSFTDARVVTSVMVVRHGRRPENPDWYPGAKYISNLRSLEADQDTRDFCLQQDLMLFFETPFLWGLLDFCRVNGVATVLMPMHECMPDPLPALPNAFLCPSLLDLRCFPQRHPVRSEFIPVPVEDTFPARWRTRTVCNTFVHNAGNGGLKGRNGTRTVLEAWPLVKSPARLVVRCQDPRWDERGAYQLSAPRGDPRVEVHYGTFPRETLYDEGDAFLFPERFNGLSLPLQEARAAGMLVVATDRFPVNTWLPREPLIAPAGTTTSRVSGRCRAFEEAVVRPEDVAAKVDALYGTNVSEYSCRGRAWAEQHSWAALRPRYLRFLEAVRSEVPRRRAAV